MLEIGDKGLVWKDTTTKISCCVIQDKNGDLHLFQNDLTYYLAGETFSGAKFSVWDGDIPRCGDDKTRRPGAVKITNPDLIRFLKDCIQKDV